MAALGDVGREVLTPTHLSTLAIAGTLGLGNKDYSREVPPKKSTTETGPTLPTFGQIFPSGR